MSNKTLLSLSGIALLVGAVFVGSGYILSGALPNDASKYAHALYLPASLLKFGGGLLFLIGLPGMYAYQARQAGKLGLIGFAASFLGFAAFEVGSGPLYGFIPPMLAANPATQSLVSQPGNGALENQLGTWFLVYFIFGMIATNLGIILYGIATFRARVYPRLAAIPMVLGIPAVFLLGSFAGDLPVALVFLGFAWCGLMLFRQAAIGLPRIEASPVGVQRSLG
jgi:hypothetical protein